LDSCPIPQTAAADNSTPGASKEKEILTEVSRSSKPEHDA
jgi:hypothetical protein